MSENDAVERLELVVATPALDVVKIELDGFGFEVTEKDSDPTLGLTLLELRASDASTSSEDNEQYKGLTRDPVSPADLLLVRLRHSIAAKYDRWVPAMGKNRTVGSVASTNDDRVGAQSGIIIGGGTGEPTLSTRGDYWTTDDETAGQYSNVAVLDTQISAADALTGKVLAAAADYVQHQDLYPFEIGHATFVTGLIAAHAPATPLRVNAILTEKNETTSTWKLARAMVKLVDSGAKVINLSLGCMTEDHRPPFALRRAVEVLTPQAVIVAAAGNYDANSTRNPPPFWPAAFDNVVAVGAYDLRQNTAPFSPRAPWVDLEARGVDVVSSYLTGRVAVWNDRTTTFTGYANWQGTSHATATVTGMIAARMKPGTSAADVVEMMRNGEVDGVRRAKYNGG